VRLTINNDDVSYSLEHEKTLGEVVAGVRAWIAAAGFVITAMTADKRDLLQSPEDAWGTASVENIGTLAVAAAHTGEMKIAHWRTVETWLGMLEEEIVRTADAAEDTLDDLLQGLPQTLEGFTANPFLPPGSDAETRFAGTFTGLGSAGIRGWTPEKRREAVELVREMRGYVQARLEASNRPGDSLARCVALLRGCMAELKDVSVLLQTGRDRPAMEAVIRFADVVQSLMDLLPFLPPDTERARTLVELTPILRDLVAAFGSRDSVLIGDLLEYEVAPRVERIVPLLEKTLLEKTDLPKEPG
jgi:hypothetical protein